MFPIEGWGFNPFAVSTKILLQTVGFYRMLFSNIFGFFVSHCLQDGGALKLPEIKSSVSSPYDTFSETKTVYLTEKAMTIAQH